MRARVYVVDTKVVVAGLLTGDDSAPAARVLERMLDATLPFLVSSVLLAEYREVLLRSRIRSRHGLSEDEIDDLLTELVANAIVREPERSATRARSRQDQHLWDLLATEHGSVLITGDRRLLNQPPPGASVIPPAGLS